MKAAKPGSRREVGQKGEDLAAQFFTDKGSRVIRRNWRCRSGELDLIVEEEGILVFVEVRTRRATGRFGTPQESVDYRKQRQVRETAQVYLHQTGGHDRQIRFDLVSVMLDLKGDVLEVQHLPFAF
ncbi:YraN family protein [Paenibacillus sp. CC-CFT747]|nr:YraN family protein [Paenibacillus sp. CC-CFT747]